MRYTVLAINNEAGNVSVKFESDQGDVKVPSDRATNTIFGLDLTSADTLKAGLEDYTRNFANGLQQEQENSTDTVPKDVSALINKPQTVDVTED